MPTVAIDDNDPSILYSGPWGLSGNKNEFQSTTHRAGVMGAQFSLAFEGIAIAVYGTITAPDDYPGAVSQYTIDGENIAVYKSPTVPSPEYHILFFQSPMLTHGQHLLLGTTTSSGTSFYLDYIVVTTLDEEDMPPQSKASTYTVIKETTILASSPSSPTTSFLSAPSSFLPPPPPSLPSSSPSPSPSPLPSPASPTTSQHTLTNTGSEPFPTSGNDFQIPSRTSTPGPTISKRIPTGAIVGAVTAGVLIIVVIVVFSLWHHRRKLKEYSIIQKQSGATGGETNCAYSTTGTISNSYDSTAPLETTGITPFAVSEVLEVDQRRSKDDTLITIPPNSIHSLEASFTDLSSINRGGIRERPSINSDHTPSDGRVTKSSYHSRPDSARAAPGISPLLAANIEAPSSTLRSSGVHFAVYWTATDDSLPPAYQAAERES